MRVKVLFPTHGLVCFEQTPLPVNKQGTVVSSPKHQRPAGAPDCGSLGQGCSSALAASFHLIPLISALILSYHCHFSIVYS